MFPISAILRPLRIHGRDNSLSICLSRNFTRRSRANAAERIEVLLDVWRHLGPVSPVDSMQPSPNYFEEEEEEPHGLQRPYRRSNPFSLTFEQTRAIHPIKPVFMTRRGEH